MKSNFFPGKSKLGLSALTAALALAGFAGYALAQEGYSHVRIVRLSFTQGTVSIQRPGSSQWEAAPTNTPIEEGFAVSTAADSYAEVQFENSSTARLGEQSEIDFTQLALAPSGAKINRMQLAGGYATFTVKPASGDVYEVTTADSTLSPSGNTTFRVDLNAALERVEVFKGIVNVSSSYGSSQLTQNDVLVIQPGTDQAYVVTHGITKDAWDKWVESRQQVLSAQYNQQGIQGTNPYPAYSSMYGWNDLMYYGNWNFVPGYGYGWCPYVGASWVPYSFGSWAWYSGFGWTWISAEPWGWVPYHYGYWSFISGSGWYWFPNHFNTWSPALVSWVQGSNWVGWRPKIAPGHGPACTGSTRCFIAVGTPKFQGGQMISPADTLNVNPSEGRSVGAPSIAPLSATGRERGRIGVAGQAALNRDKTTWTTAVGTAQKSGSGNGLTANDRRRPRFGSQAPSVVLPSAVSGATNSPVAPRRGIVYDAGSGGYVNDPNSAANANPPASAGSAPAPQQEEHHFNFFGLFGHRNAPNNAPSSSEAGAAPRSSRSPSTGEARRAPSSSSTPRSVSVPQSQPSYHSTPAPAPAPAPSYSGGSFGGGGGGGGGRSAGVARGGASRGGGRPH